MLQLEQQGHVTIGIEKPPLLCPRPSLHSPILPSSEALPGTSSPGSLSAPDENVPGAIDFVSLLSPRPVLQIDYPNKADDAVRLRQLV